MKPPWQFLLLVSLFYLLFDKAYLFQVVPTCCCKYTLTYLGMPRIPESSGADGDNWANGGPTGEQTGPGRRGPPADPGGRDAARPTGPTWNKMHPTWKVFSAAASAWCAVRGHGCHIELSGGERREEGAGRKAGGGRRWFHKAKSMGPPNNGFLFFPVSLVKCLTTQRRLPRARDSVFPAPTHTVCTSIREHKTTQHDPIRNAGPEHQAKHGGDAG